MLYVGNTKYKIHIGNSSYKIATPYDYEVQWLERGGKQYIDTGVLANNKITRVSAEVFDALYDSGFVYGARRDNVRDYMAVYYKRMSMHTMANVFNNEANVSYTEGGDYVVIYTSKDDSTTKQEGITCNGVFAASPKNSIMDFNDLNLFLFIMNTNGVADFTYQYNGIRLRLGNVKIWRSNVLVRDFIPVVKGGIGYMFDKVEKKLYGNLGEGQFGIGPVKILPDNYKQVEYIESSGQQYINLGFPISNTMNFYIKCQCLAAGFVFGCRTGPSSNVSGFNFDTTGSLIGIRMGQTILSGNIGWEVGKIYEVKIENRNCVMNGNVISTTAYGSNYYSGNCYLFACNNNGSLSNTIYNSNRIFRFKIYNNNATILDLIPCISPNNEVGMYDLGTGTFFGNNGSGVFTAGPEL